MNRYGCEIGDETRVGPFVGIQKGVSDRFPRATTEDGTLAGDGDWKCEATLVRLLRAV